MKDISIRDIDVNIVRKLPKDKLKKLKLVPYKEDDDYIYLLIVEEKEEILNEIKFIFDKKVKIKLETEEVIYKLIDTVYIGENLDLLNIILRKAIYSKASDIHLEPFELYVVIRIRVDGVLAVVYKISNLEYQLLISKIKNLSNLDITERRRPQDGKMYIEVDNEKYDLRVSIIPVFYGEKTVIRILYGRVFNYSIDSLRITESQRKKLESIVKVNNGLVIVNGPTGSGKSTTLYTILQELNSEDKNISTLEDPIEVLIPGINQVNLNRSVNLTFAEGIRSLLRQDPDILMVGEIRDEETASIAVRASLTGHKVYSTIHTKDPREVYYRLEEMGIEEYLIRDSLVGIISQRLVKLLCNKCKIYIGDINLDGENIKTYKKCGCSVCNDTGYKGRGLVVAVHYINRNMKNELINLKNNNNILSNEEMKDNLKDFIKKEEISIDDYINFLELEELQGLDEKWLVEGSKL